MTTDPCTRYENDLRAALTRRIERLAQYIDNMLVAAQSNPHMIELVDEAIASLEDYEAQLRRLEQ